jgi:DNA-binding HxlR family transcriptional regulator
VSQRANEHDLDALATVDDSTPLHRLLDQVDRPIAYRSRRVRALRIGDPADLALLRAVSRGEWATAGFRNRDLRRVLHPTPHPTTPVEARRLTAKITRQLRLLRAHGLIHKISRTHRYRLTPKGQLLTAALFAARNATLKQLIGTAA